MLRLFFIILGAFLVWAGTGLARQEMAVIDARFVARDGRPRALKAPEAKIEQAFLELSARRTLRSDWLEAQIDLASELDRIGFPRGFVPSPLREQRVRSSAEDLGRASPMTADAWCLMALSEAKAPASPGTRFEALLRACYAFGPREISLVETRLHLALAVWEALPKDLKTVALVDIASALQDHRVRSWMLDRLAYGIAVIAPMRQDIALALVSPYGAEREQRFLKQILSYRKAHGARSDPFQ